MAADDYFQGLYETARRPDELLVEALIPVPRASSVSVFKELAQRHGDFAIAGVAFHLEMDAGVVADARLVYFGSEDKPTLAQGARSAIVGRGIDAASAAAAASALENDLSPDVQPARQQPDAPASAARADPARAGHGSRASEAGMSEDTLQVSLDVNGERVTRTVPVRQHLVDFLRTDLGSPARISAASTAYAAPVRCASTAGSCAAA